jgi:hypothetical protein
MKTLHWTPKQAPTDEDPKSERTPSGRLRVGNVIHIQEPMGDDTLVMHRPFARLEDVIASLPMTTLPLQRAPHIPPAAEPARREESGVELREIVERDDRTQVMARPADLAPTVPAAPAIPVTPAEAPAEHAVVKPLFDSMKLNKLVVSSYKFMGFAILGVILAGLASFIATNLFYLVNASWVTPLVLSPTDPRVLQIDAQLSSEKAARDGVATQRLQLLSQLEDARRVQASEQQFQAAFQESMAAEAADRGSQLAQLQHLLGALQRTRAEVAATSKDYSAVSKDALKDEYAAGLIGKDEATRGGYELAQMQTANVALHEKHVEIDGRIIELQRAVSALKNRKGAASYEVLHMRHEYEQSLLASQKAAGDADAIAKSVAMLDATMAGYDAQIARIARAPYVMAADKSMPTAFVPYDNIGAAKVDDAVFACAAGPLFCKRVGRVAEVLDGEVIEKHPLHNRELRGVLVRLALDDATAVQHPVLHLHRKPLGI